jgi:hypothetical protein
MICAVHQAPRDAVGIVMSGPHAGRLVRVLDPEMNLVTGPTGPEVQFLDTGVAVPISWVTSIEIP